MLSINYKKNITTNVMLSEKPHTYGGKEMESS